MLRSATVREWPHFTVGVSFTYRLDCLLTTFPSQEAGFDASESLLSGVFEPTVNLNVDPIIGAVQLAELDSDKLARP